MRERIAEMGEMERADKFLLKIWIDGRFNIGNLVGDTLSFLALVAVQQGDASAITGRIADAGNRF
jgi:hypothetical protein